MDDIIPLEVHHAEQRENTGVVNSRTCVLKVISIDVGWPRVARVTRPCKSPGRDLT